MSSGLTDAFVAACDASVARTVDPVAFEPLLAEICATAARAWPSFDVDRAAFVAHLAGRIQPDTDARESLGGLHAADLYLALACGRGEHRALLELEKVFRALPEALHRLADRAPVEDVIQTLRTKLLVTGSTPPKILDYAGRGPLAGWIRVSAVRTAVSMGRRSNVAAAAPVTREVLLAVPEVADDPELAHFRARYQAEFKVAFEEAVTALEDQQRTLLRLSLVDRLSIDQLGVIFHVHRATAARWIQRAMELVHAGTRDRLVARLKLSESDLDGFMRLVQSDFEISIQRVLTGDENVS